MTDQDDRPSREDAVYGKIATSLQRYGVGIALVAPLLLVSLVPTGQAGVLLVAVIYLGEAVVYGAMQRRRRGARSGPGPALQALWVVFASLLIMGGLVGLSASGEPAALVAIALGLGIIAWVWSRVARASGEDSRIFLARIARRILYVGVGAAGILVVRGVALGMGIPVIIAIVLALGVGAVLMVWILSRTLQPAFDPSQTLGYTPPAPDGTAVEGTSGPVGREPDD